MKLGIHSAGINTPQMKLEPIETTLMIGNSTLADEKRLESRNAKAMAKTIKMAEFAIIMRPCVVNNISPTRMAPIPI